MRDRGRMAQKVVRFVRWCVRHESVCVHLISFWQWNRILRSTVRIILTQLFFSHFNTVEQLIYFQYTWIYDPTVIYNNNTKLQNPIGFYSSIVTWIYATTLMFSLRLFYIKIMRWTKYNNSKNKYWHKQHTYL